MQVEDDDPQIGGVGDLESISHAHVKWYWTFLENTFVDVLNLGEDQAREAVGVLKHRLAMLDEHRRIFWFHQPPLQVAIDYIGMERPLSPDTKRRYSELINIGGSDKPNDFSFTRAEPDEA